MNNMKIVVLCGGISTERDVSLSSGKMIYEALKGLGHRVVLTDVYMGLSLKDDEVTEEIFDGSPDLISDEKSINRIKPDISQIKSRKREGALGYFGPGVLKLCRLSDLVFMALHGEDGENGKVQGVFDLLDVNYTGSDPMGSALAMDKTITKKLFLQAGVPTAEFYGVVSKDSVDRIGYPCVIKICHGGSSVGVYICHNREEALKALDEAAGFGDEIIAERYIRGREFSVGLIQGKALPAIEIAPVSGFYNYENKYQPGATVETCPADISEAAAEKMKKAAELVYEVLKIRDYGRVDFMMDEYENVYALEMNTLPGMTPVSLLPQEAAAVGLSFPQLCQKLVENALSGDRK